MGIRAAIASARGADDISASSQAVSRGGCWRRTLGRIDRVHIGAITMRKTFAAFVLLIPSLPLALALPNINSLSVRYNSQKTAAKPEGELKAQLDEVDKAVAEARRTGNTAEMRRQFARGFALLNKDAWTPALDYRHSLVLRSDRTVIDSSAPYAFRVEQIYRPAIDLTPALSTRVSIRPRPSPARPGTPAAPPRSLGTFDGLSRDLRESPFTIDVDLAGIADGAYLIEAEVVDGATSLGVASLGVFLHRGLDAKLKALETAAASVAEGVRADVVYPADVV